jgi:hypothetical protein
MSAKNWPSRKRPGPSLEGQLDALPLLVTQPTRVELGTYKGLKFGVVLHSQVPPDVFVEGSAMRITSLSREHQGPRAVLNAVERLISGYGPEAQRIGEDLAIAQSQLRDYQERLGAPFAHEKYQVELTESRDELKLILSGRKSEAGLTAGDLAGQIKALKSSQTIETTRERTSHRSITAAEPVTTRIRKRAEAAGAPEAAMQPGPGGPEAETSESAKATWLSFATKLASLGVESAYTTRIRAEASKREQTHQQRLASERRREDPEQTRS